MNCILKQLNRIVWVKGCELLKERNKAARQFRRIGSLTGSRNTEYQEQFIMSVHAEEFRYDKNYENRIPATCQRTYDRCSFFLAKCSDGLVLLSTHHQQSHTFSTKKSDHTGFWKRQSGLVISGNFHFSHY